jgi:multidrug efflux pump subunit AcrB/outer membrane protein TolC
MNPIKASLRYPAVALILTALAVAVGLRAFFNMPRTEDPTITIRTGLVLAQYPGATSEQVEKQVAKTLEKHIFKFPEVCKEKTFSTSRPGLVIVNVELEEYVKNADLFWAKLRNEMNETRATELPAGVRGPIVNSDFGDTVAMLIAVHGSRYGYRELRDYVDRIQDELRTVRDVGKMARYGEQSEQVEITSSLSRLSQYFADPLRVIQALMQRNVIEGSGSVDADRTKVPLRTTGFFTTEDQIRSVLVDVSKTGQPVYIRDFARVERRYQDPSFIVRYDGQPSVLLSVEMQKGRNIVELGDRIAACLASLHGLLPPGIKLDLLANQPAVVKSRIARLSHEFMLAIGSVILVTLLLLPMRLAVIAALAIPITLCTTLGFMNALGIQLHQVSISALIVVLGIVVDDAIVIADNYVELLDRKAPIADVPWRSASDVVVPVLTATITIICSFLPLLILTGSVGEFIEALPLTVAISLSVSFMVAVLLTPMLCRFFIKKGLHDHEATGKQKATVLDRLQSAHKTAIVYLMARKRLALAIGAAAVLVGVLLFRLVPQQFFPLAERNQFVIDVWMRQGSRIEATDSVVQRMEKHLAGIRQIAHYASFVGQSAPRFYYNVNPQQPDAAYSQLIVTTRSEDETPRLVADLRTDLAKLAPEALVIVKELQQGTQMEAPLEVRISGDDIGELKRIGSQVEDIVRAVPFSQMTYRDYFNDSYMVDINIDNELSNRLGLTNASVSRLLSGAFDGGPVSTFWEGDRPVTILLRLDQDARSSFADVKDAYVTSAVTHASVPLRSIATLKPEWQTSRIVRRNGVRTLTVRSFVERGHYVSDLLKAVAPRIAALPLPSGYRMEYGGEKWNQDEIFPQMLIALVISLVAIFLVLLIQFKNLSEPLIVMSSIPLALLGAVFGLIVTRNPFGFTAFVGLISLCGIVVRNAIILIDYINEKMAEGHSIEVAAAEAGQRRLRPIFLTTMAAAVGVTPLILSGSSLWSPLASVIAVGLIFSMFFTLLVVPVLFVVVRSRARRSPAPIAAVVLAALFLFSSGQVLAETRKLTLQEAVEIALSGNSVLKIGKAKVREGREKVTSARADYFPHLSNNSTYAGLTDRQLVSIPAGGLGTLPGLGPFPTNKITIDQGSNTFLLSTTTLGQPITQLFKVSQGEKIATADRRAAEADLRKAENEVVFAVHRLYYGLLVAGKQKEAAEAALRASEEALRESEDAVRSGDVLGVEATGSRVRLLQNKQALISAEIQLSDLASEMSDLLGLPLDTQFEPADVPSRQSSEQSREDYLREALARNPEVASAMESVSKAQSGVRAARYEYIPDIGAFGRYIYQDGMPFVTRSIGAFGLQMTWDIFDWGKREAIIGQRSEQLVQAQENLHRIRRAIEIEVDKAFRKLGQTKTVLEVAREALVLQKERLRLSADRMKTGTVTEAGYAESLAALKKAECDELQARLGHELALSDLDRIAARSRE